MIPDTTALILIDIQNDFCPGGALAVPKGDEVAPLAAQLAKRFQRVLATQDWHPAGHGSFASAYSGKKPFEMGTLGGLPQVLWPDHCVQGTPGASFHPALAGVAFEKVFPKGTDPQVDSYSGFFDNAKKRGTGLAEWLRTHGVVRVALAGLATDYCVKATALDARELGFETILFPEACRAVDLAPGDGEKALAEMKAAGVKMADVTDLIARGAL